jgi:hypothetical protein
MRFLRLIGVGHKPKSRPGYLKLSAVSRKRWRIAPDPSATSSRHSGLSPSRAMVSRIMSEHAIAASSQAAPSSGKSTATSLEWGPWRIRNVYWVTALECVMGHGGGKIQLRAQNVGPVPDRSPIMAAANERGRHPGRPCTQGVGVGGSTSGARGLRSGGGLVSTCDVKSAAFSTNTAASSGFAVDLANLSSVVA